MKTQEIVNRINEKLQNETKNLSPSKFITAARVNQYRKDLSPPPQKYPGKNYYNYTEQHLMFLYEVWKGISLEDLTKKGAFKKAGQLDLN